MSYMPMQHLASPTYRSNILTCPTCHLNTPNVYCLPDSNISALIASQHICESYLQWPHPNMSYLQAQHTLPCHAYQARTFSSHSIHRCYHSSRPTSAVSFDLQGSGPPVQHHRQQANYGGPSSRNFSQPNHPVCFQSCAEVHAGPTPQLPAT